MKENVRQCIAEECGEQSLGIDPNSVHPPVLVIGLGNPILGDDGVGWRVAERVRTHLIVKEQAELADHTDLIQSDFPSLVTDTIFHFPIEIDCLSLGGLSLMERLIGYDRVIIIDAITTQENPPGFVNSFPLEELPKRAAGHLSAAHDTTLQTAIEVGRSLDAKLPTEIMIVALEAIINYDFTEQLTSAVDAAIPLAVQSVLELLTKWDKEYEFS